jgi:hypothetical protein
VVLHQKVRDTSSRVLGLLGDRFGCLRHVGGASGLADDDKQSLTHANHAHDRLINRDTAGRERDVLRLQKSAQRFDGC